MCLDGRVPKRYWRSTSSVCQCTSRESEAAALDDNNYHEGRRVEERNEGGMPFREHGERWEREAFEKVTFEQRPEC